MSVPISHERPTTSVLSIGWTHQRAVGILVVAALVRLALLALVGDLELRNDEVQYQEIAANVVTTGSFALDGHLTSWRPPLYPAVMASVYWVTGTTDPWVVRGFQILLGLATAVVAFVLARRAFGPDAGLIALGITAFYPSLLFYTNHILTEGLFTFLVTAAAGAFAVYLTGGRARWLAAAGAAAGLAALTRDVFLPVVGLMALVVVIIRRREPGRALSHAAVVVGVAIALIAPWTARNMMVHGTFTPIATNGGPSFLAGNNPNTPIDRPWQYQDLPRELRWRSIVPETLTEGRRQQLAYAAAFEFIASHPGLTLRRAVVKAANVWGLEREVIGTILKDSYGGRWRAATLPLTAVICGVYVLTLLGGVVGLSFAVARADGWRPFHLFAVTLAVFVTVVHAGAFGHPRYHLPLMPLAAAYAAHAWTIRARIWQARRSRPFIVATALAVVALAVWIRELALELGRFGGLVGG